MCPRLDTSAARINRIMKQERAVVPIEASPIAGLLNESQLAQVLGISVASLRRWRLLRKGPKYVKIGSAVRYPADDVNAWIATRPTGGEQVKVAR